MKSAISFFACIVVVPLIYSVLAVKLGLPINLALVFLGSIVAGIGTVLSMQADI